MKSNEDAAELIKRFGLKETIGGYTLQLLTAQDPHRLLVQVNDFPALHSDRTAMRSYFQAVTDVFCSLADGVKGIDWHFVRSDAPWATMSFDASPAQTQEDFQSCYYRMEQAAGSYRPALNQTLFSDEILYLSPQLSNSVNVQQHLAISPNIYIFTFDPDRFDAEDLKNSSLQQAAWDGYSAPIYTITPLTDADRAALSAYLDLSPYTTQTCTTVHDSDGQDTGYRLYQMDTDVFILHFTTENGTQTLDYLIRLTEESQ